jgi:hypothetical protein
MSNKPLKIVSDVPLPARTKLPPLPLAEMNIGDSFFVEIDQSDARLVQMLRQRASRFQRDSKEAAKFSVCREGADGMRVFRIQ